jgi:hypothetical protein
VNRKIKIIVKFFLNFKVRFPSYRKYTTETNVTAPFRMTGFDIHRSDEYQSFIVRVDQEAAKSVRH